MNPSDFSDEELFAYYFNIADEIDGGLTLDELDKDAVQAARAAADTYGLSWPPELAEAEEFSLDHPELRG